MLPLQEKLIQDINAIDIPNKDKLSLIEDIKNFNEKDLSYYYYVSEFEGKGVYKEYPVDIETFIHDPYYLGSIYSGNIFPIWENLLKEVYPAPLITRYDEIIISAGIRCHGLGTKILMYDGSIKNVEDVVVGDQLMGDDSTPRNVLSLARGRDQMYKVIPNKGGDPFTCNSEHILSLKCTSTKYQSNLYKKNSIENISIKDYLSKNIIFKNYYKLYRAQVEFNNFKELEVDPYIYGLYLGDGNTLQTRLTTIDKEIADIWCNYGKSLGYEIKEYSKKKTEAVTYALTNGLDSLKRKVKNLTTGKEFDSLIDAAKFYGVKSTSQIREACSDVRKSACGYKWCYVGEYKRGNKLLDFIRLSVDENGKRIRKEYLTSNREDRLKLLAGIVDTDGYIDHRSTGYISISTKLKGLAEDYAFLARSLGFRASVRERNKFVKYLNKNYTSYDVNISGKVDLIPSVLSRRQGIKPKEKLDYLKTGFKIESLGEGDYYGFELDGNHLYCLGDFTVTHNSGKSTSSAVSMLYEIYKLLCMVDPAGFYLGKSTGRLVFGLLSFSEDNIKKYVKDIENGLTMSPFFKEHVTKDLSMSNITKGGTHITDNIILSAGSSESRITGGDLFCCIADEANIKPKNAAEEDFVEKRIKMWEEVLLRKSSTLSKAPAMSGIVWMVSSPTENRDVINERIYLVHKNNIKGVKILDNVSTWVARNEILEDTFDFYLGSDTKDPIILDDTVDRSNYVYGNILEQGIDYTKYESGTILHVPFTNLKGEEDYLSWFRESTVKAIRDIAGRRTSSDTALFGSVGIFSRVFSKENDIFSKDVLTINFMEGRQFSFGDYLLNKEYFSNPNSKNCFRYLHLDIASKKDMFGLASVYSDILKFRADNGAEISKRMYFVDFCLGIGASSGCEVDIIKVLEFLYDIKKQGYPIKIITTDSHQGILARQHIKSHGIETKYLSLELSKDPYYNLKNTVLTESLIGYKNPLLIKELGGLREYDSKIGKSKGYTDDLSDSLAGALYSCMLDRHGFKTSNDVMDNIIAAQNNSLSSMSTIESILFGLYSEDINNHNNNGSGRLGLGY